MTTVTFCGCRLVVSAHVTLLTRDRSVGSRQGELCKVVIEACLPAQGGDRMTIRALNRETCREVVWICRGNVLSTVTPNAGNRRAHVLMIRCAHVTILTTQRRVFTDKREPGKLMALHHIRYLPRLIGVAPGAVGAKLRFMNVGMARCAFFADCFELQTCMTTRTGCSFVLTLENKACLFVMEIGIRPHAPRVCGVT